MATSLEELLAKEGFRGGRSGTRARPSFKAEAASMPRYPFGDQGKRDSPSGPSMRRIKTERTRSDVTRYSLRGESPGSNSSLSRRPRDDLVKREKLDSRLKAEHRGRGSKDVKEDKTLKVETLEDVKGSEIVEVGVEENETFKDIHSDIAYYSERTERSSKGNGSKERQREGKGKDKKVPERHHSISNENLEKHSEFSNDNRRSVDQSEAVYESSVRGSKIGNGFEDDQRPKNQKRAPAVPEIALDEVAVKAVISILNGYIKRFFKDAEFRTTLRQNCFSSLASIEIEEGNSIEIKAKANLEQAIETVEKAVEAAAGTKDLKTAALLLSVITSLNSNDLKDDYTSGTPNSRLSACAHIYLSVIYKLRKKDKVSAKHLLQVFCDSPFLARTLLLSELWDYLFFPHLSHLKTWYKKEADPLFNTASKITKLKFLDKVYNEVLDSCTYQFAVYYKDWLAEGVEAPSIPSVNIPFISQQGGSQDHSSGPASPAAPFSPQPMVSKKLYDAVFGHSSKPRVYDAEENWKADNFNNGANSSGSSPIQVKQTLTSSSEMVKYPGQDIENHSPENLQDNTSILDNGLLSASDEEWKLVNVSVSPDTDLKDDNRKSSAGQVSAGDTHMLNSSSHTKENELTLKTLAKSVFKIQRTEDSGDLTVSNLLHPKKAINASASIEGLNGSHESFDEGSIFESIPQDFVCPLTRQLFEDPVTLETGQTFEREAIRKWFNQGNRTCPLTGKTLECPTIPLTNFILKRMIDSWKLERCNHLLSFASQIFKNSEAYDSRQRNEDALFILEKLLASSSREERLTNAKHLISLGVLEFLIKRFEFGSLEEKTLVAALLSCCIEAESSCRNHIAIKIDKQCLFELLHGNQSKSARNVVGLLIELVCLSRRKGVTQFISGLPSETIVHAMDILLVYLQSSPAEEPLVAVLILHLDLLVEPRKYSIYRKEAVHAISMALESSLTDEKVREQSCRALNVLGGIFSASGNSSTESWILKQAGFDKNHEVNSREDNLLLDDPLSPEDEEESSEEWLRNLSESLLANGKMSILETISKCLSSGILDLVRACLTTIAWLSCGISLLPDSELQLFGFPTLISGLKEILEDDEQIEHQVLASMSLLNLSKNPECGSLLMIIAEEIAVPLQSLAEVTWTAKELHAIISGEDP
ncbi:putative E3 ubiquitin-protein ligase LIN-1 [Populus nigra]|uniref:putative E3 ubiquitin-protein ligase LIN-1 n=1 Tax=Populus nigra TaxID=3691 RepID=UPI002B265C35|nr:putative E3 ubiquitin-protein ligase LIN-1 [Populus nigra]